MYTRIAFLVRHGESTSNAGEKSSDPHSPPLTQRGRQQAELVARALSPRPRVVVRSPFTRTLQTAQPLLDSLPNARALIWPVHEFSYLSPERCPDSTYDERSDIRTGYWERADPHHIDGKGAESFANLIRRVDDTIARLKALEADPVAVFTHGLFIEAIRMRIRSPTMPIDSHAMRAFYWLLGNPVPNASVTELILTGKGIFIGRTAVDHIPEGMRTS